MVDDGRYFSCFPKFCLSISIGGIIKVWYHLGISLQSTFLRAGVRTLWRHIPATTHLRSSQDTFLPELEAPVLPEGTATAAIF
jgi:hypothetical protein